MPCVSCLALESAKMCLSTRFRCSATWAEAMAAPHCSVSGNSNGLVSTDWRKSFATKNLQQCCRLHAPFMLSEVSRSDHILTSTSHTTQSMVPTQDFVVQLQGTYNARYKHNAVATSSNLILIVERRTGEPEAAGCGPAVHQPPAVDAEGTAWKSGSYLVLLFCASPDLWLPFWHLLVPLEQIHNPTCAS
jgi:hypothetical protein